MTHISVSDIFYFIYPRMNLSSSNKLFSQNILQKKESKKIIHWDQNCTHHHSSIDPHTVHLQWSFGQNQKAKDTQFTLTGNFNLTFKSIYWYKTVSQIKKRSNRHTCILKGKQEWLKLNFYVNSSPRWFPALPLGEGQFSVSSFLLHVISMWTQPSRAMGIQGHRGYVTSNWIYVKVTHPFLLTAVYRHGLQTGPFFVHLQLPHQCGNILQSQVSREMPVQRLWFILSGEWGFNDMLHAGSLKVLQGPWLDCVRIRHRGKINKLKPLRTYSSA